MSYLGWKITLLACSRGFSFHAYPGKEEDGEPLSNHAYYPDRSTALYAAHIFIRKQIIRSWFDQIIDPLVERCLISESAHAFLLRSVKRLTRA